MPKKEREGESDGGKVCSYKGPTLPSSADTIPLVSRNGNEYEYLHKYKTPSFYHHKKEIALIKPIYYPI